MPPEVPFTFECAGDLRGLLEVVKARRRVHGRVEPFFGIPAVVVVIARMWTPAVAITVYVDRVAHMTCEEEPQRASRERLLFNVLEVRAFESVDDCRTDEADRCRVVEYLRQALGGASSVERPMTRYGNFGCGRYAFHGGVRLQPTLRITLCPTVLVHCHHEPRCSTADHLVVAPTNWRYVDSYDRVVLVNLIAKVCVYQMSTRPDHRACAVDGCVVGGVYPSDEIGHPAAHVLQVGAVSHKDH